MIDQKLPLPSPPFSLSCFSFLSGLTHGHFMGSVSTKKGVSAVSYRYDSFQGAVRSMIRTEGWRSLYQGLTPALLGNSTSWGLYFLL